MYIHTSRRCKEIALAVIPGITLIPCTAVVCALSGSNRARCCRIPSLAPLQRCATTNVVLSGEGRRLGSTAAKAVGVSCEVVDAALRASPVPRLGFEGGCRVSAACSRGRSFSSAPCLSRTCPPLAFPRALVVGVIQTAAHGHKLVQRKCARLLSAGCLAELWSSSPPHVAAPRSRSTLSATHGAQRSRRMRTAQLNRKVSADCRVSRAAWTPSGPGVRRGAAPRRSKSGRKRCGSDEHRHRQHPLPSNTRLTAGRAAQRRRRDGAR